MDFASHFLGREYLKALVPLLRRYSCEADEERKADIDHHKNDQLKKQEEGKNDWKKELSSNSESAVSEVLSEISGLEECIV